MVDILLFVYLAAPGVLGLIAALYALTRAPDRIQLATIALFVASVIYFAQAFELSKQDGPAGIFGVVLGIYSLSIYICMAALAIYFKQWAWRAAIAAFALHVALGLVGLPSAFQQGAKGILAFAAYLSIAVVGIWALLHKGSRQAVTPQGEA